MSRCSLYIGGVVLTGVLAVLLSDVYFDIILKDTSAVLNMSEVEAIGKNTLKSAVSGDVVTVESLWEKQPVVMVFFRRFGCGFCRVAAKQISSIKDDLDANNVRLVGVGVEELGKEEFLKGNFFKGELYIDEDKKCYKDLKYKRFGLLGMLPAMITKTSRDAIAAVRSEKVGSDMKGDIYQVGGVLVVGAGGEKILLSHRQQSLADHVDTNEVLKSLGIAAKEKAAEPVENAQCAADGVTAACE